VGTITVTPDPFHLVNYDSAVIRGIVEEMVGTLGLPTDVDVTLTIDEALPHPIIGSMADVVDGAVDLWCSGGCFEARHQSRAFSEPHARAEITGMVLRARDRLVGGFEDAPSDAELTLAERAAWDVYAWGRVAALGHSIHVQKRRYDFRLQHGFSDASDAAFERVWSSPGLTWGAIRELCVETGAADRPKAKLPADLLRRGSRH
jgi:hypothetical protein